MKERKWALILFLLGGAVIGQLLAELTKSVHFLKWLSFGQSFGVSPDSPLQLELVFMRLKFGLTLNLTVSVILCMAGAALLYRKFGR